MITVQTIDKANGVKVFRKDGNAISAHKAFELWQKGTKAHATAQVCFLKWKARQPKAVLTLNK
jgi:hypothetical protein